MLKALLALLALLLATSCTRLPHVDPLPRTPQTQRLTEVRVTSSCGGAPVPFAGTAAGVIVSERHVLTAAHVVACSELPTVRVYLRDGRVFRMYVERDDAAFGEGRDIARLEIASAERFGLRVPPPALGELESGSTVCLPQGCGRAVHYTHLLVQVTSKPGDSGTGVYDWYGNLLGIAVSTFGEWTRIEPVGGYWLEGT